MSSLRHKCIYANVSIPVIAKLNRFSQENSSKISWISKIATMKYALNNIAGGIP